MTTNPFFCATEVWTPTADRQHLDLTAGLYHDMPYFEAISRGMRFGREEGLPGKAWASGRPIVLKDLSNSYFRRGDAAMTDGLSCAVALPLFAQGGLTAVVVFFFGDSRYRRGALEIWTAPEGGSEMALVDGYFGRTERFGITAHDTTFSMGEGLPGHVWESGLPMILADVASDDAFIRHESAENFTIRRAVGIPCSADGPDNWVMTMLSVRSAPIARRFECWTTDAASGQFKFADGYCESTEALADSYAGADVPLASGLFAEVAQSGIPAICTDLAKADSQVARCAGAAGMVSMFVLPTYVKCEFKALLVWYM